MHGKLSGYLGVVVITKLTLSKEIITVAKLVTTL
jgi:hypothetical protein